MANKQYMDAYNKRYYQEHREEKLKEWHERRSTQKALVETIALHYGCRNPNCRWQGEYKPYFLDFHHLDPSTKKKRISMLYAHSKSTIATEINKCVVLCRNCHNEIHSKKLNLTEQMLCKVTNELLVERQ